MNAGFAEWGTIAKTVAGGGTFGRGALLLSIVVHGGLAAAFIGWSEPQATSPQSVPVAIVAVASAPAEAGDAAPASAPPAIAQAPHQPASPQPRAAETPAAPIVERPIEAAMDEPAPPEPEPVREAISPEPVVAPPPEPAIEPPPAPAAKPAEPPAEPIAEQIIATEPVAEPDAEQIAATEPVAEPAGEAAADRPSITEMATDPAPAIVASTAGQTAALPDPASALGTVPDDLEGGGTAFEPARHDLTALSNLEPEYPWASRRAGEEGRILLRVEVSADGTVDSINVAESSGHRRLDEAALEAVRQWRFEPARVGEQAVATSVTVPVTFRLE
ncbi:MAG: TonB family protein [Rhodospirillaceae bacterium]|nr:TonB family protein [Rhodospirillaceae bacterium]